LERGNSPTGQDFGLSKQLKGLVKDAYVHNNKLGVVITPQVSPNEVKPLAKSLVQGFHKKFSQSGLKRFDVCSDKKLI